MTTTKSCRVSRELDLRERSDDGVVEKTCEENDVKKAYKKVGSPLSFSLKR